VVIRADLWKLAQLRLGGTLRFVPCGVDEALDALRLQQRHFDQLQATLHDLAR